MFVEPGMVATLHEDLGAAECDGFFNLFVNLVERDYVGIVILFDPVKCTELAINVADIGVIDIAIDDVGDDFVPAAVVGGGFGEFTTAISESTELLQRELIKAQGLELVDALAIPNLLHKLVY